MKVTVDKVRSISQVVRETYSLDMLIGDQEEDTLKDILQDTNSVSPATVSDEIRRKEHIDEWLQQLSVSERKVIELRFGLDRRRAQDAGQIGKEFGITRERVRQIETQALNKLRIITRRKEDRPGRNASLMRNADWQARNEGHTSVPGLLHTPNSTLTMPL